MKLTAYLQLQLLRVHSHTRTSRVMICWQLAMTLSNEDIAIVHFACFAGRIKSEMIVVSEQMIQMYITLDCKIEGHYFGWPHSLDSV